jgi:hypothetical protein
MQAMRSSIFTISGVITPFDFLKLSFRKLVELEIFRVNFFLEVTGWDAVIMVHL